MANKKEFDKYLKDRYEDQVKWYDRKSMHNQKWAKRYQVLIILFAAITPVSASLNYKWVTIVSSTLVAIMVGVLKYYKFEELWQSYRTTCETLRKEKVMYDQKISVYEEVKQPERLFIERVESLISKENTAWGTIVNNDKEKST